MRAKDYFATTTKNGIDCFFKIEPKRYGAWHCDRTSIVKCYTDKFYVQATETWNALSNNEEWLILRNEMTSLIDDKYRAISND